MLALMIALLVPAQDLPLEDPPPELIPAPPVEDPCLHLVEQHKKADALVCYERRARGADADAKVARELVDLVGRLELEQPGDLDPQQRKPATVTLGKVELVASASLATAYAATLGAAMVTSTGVGGTAGGALLLASPVIGSALGLGIGTAAMIYWTDMTDGDANVMRAFLVLGVFDSILVPFDLTALLGSSALSAGPVMFFFMGGAMLTAAAVGAGVALATDLDEGAGSAAISGALWASVLSIFAANMFEAFKDGSQGAAIVLTVAGNAGFVGGLFLPHVLPLTRIDTWAIDIGGGIGLLAGASVAVFARAPNPTLGYGMMAAGASAGIVGGYFVARLVPPWLDSLPNVVAAAPLVVPDPVDARRLALGGLVTVAF